MSIKKLNFLVFGAFLLALTALTSVDVNAQGRYTNRYSKRDVGNIIAKLENSSNAFRREFDNQMDKSSLNGTSEEDRLNDIVQDYEDSLDDLRREFDRNNTWWESRNDVQDVMSDARRVNQMMNSLSFARRLERQWNNMRKDLNKLADTYDFPALDGTGFGGGGNIGNVPNWAVGTFYSRNPQTGGNIALTINANGNVTINSDGNISYATMNGDRLNNGGIEARVTRINNGIRTTRTDNGERIDYYSNFNNNNNNTGNKNIPTWAIGTFYSRNPQTGGNITLTINANGNVVINSDGNVSYATMNGDRLNNGGTEARVTRINNGIRTTRTDNGERIDYYSNYNNNNNNNANIPSWAIGTFYSRNPQTGGNITLTINANGNVVINADGNISYATMNGDRLNNGGIEARVTRTNSGIRTTRTDNGERIDYQRQGY